jgi:hypothetical protein
MAGTWSTRTTARQARPLTTPLTVPVTTATQVPPVSKGTDRDWAFPGYRTPISRGCEVSTPDEMFRGALPALTPDGEPATVIVTRQGHGSAGRVWVTFSGAWVTTAVMTDEQAERFEHLVGNARRVRS